MHRDEGHEEAGIVSCEDTGEMILTTTFRMPVKEGQ